MKIAYLLELSEEVRRPPFNGPANHIRQVFLQLAELGHEVKLLFRRDEQFWLTSDLQQFEPVSVSESKRWRLFERVTRRIQSVLSLPYLGFFESRRFARICLRELGDCDLFYERFTWMNYGGMIAATRARLPRVTEYNGDPVADLEAKGMAPSGLQKRISQAITRKVLRGAVHVVATGQGWRKNCVGTWGVAQERVSVVENGTDLLDLLERDRLHSFQEIDDALKGTRIVYLGGFYSWHGIDKLLAAAAQLVKLGTEITVTLIGSGQGEDEARNLVSELALDEVVTFTGKLKTTDYAPYLAGADIGVSPYCGWPEYSGLKIFDYKAAGLACVASGEDGQPSTLRHGETGWIVPPCDEDALAEALFTLAENVPLRRKLGQAARLDAERRHAWRHTALHLEEIFHSVVPEAK